MSAETHALSEPGERVKVLAKRAWRIVSDPKTVYLSSFSIGAVSIAAAHLTLGQHPLVSAISKDVGIALLVASLIGVSVEWYNRALHTRHLELLVNSAKEQNATILAGLDKSAATAVNTIKRKVAAELSSSIRTLERIAGAKAFAEIFGGKGIEIPGEVLSGMVESLFSITTVRHKMHVKIKLSIDQQSGMVLLKYITVVDSQSVVGSPTEAVFTLDILLPKDKIGDFQIKVGNIRLGKESPQLEIRSLTSPDRTIITHRRRVDPRERFREEYFYHELLPFEKTYPIQTLHPCRECVIDVYVDEEASSAIDVSVSSIHRDDAIEVSANELELDGGEPFRRWKLERLFPGNGFLVEWKRKADIQLAD